MDRTLLRWACVVIALICAVLWLATAIAAGFSAPGWIPPAGLLALAAAVAIP